MSELPPGWATASLAQLGIWSGGGTPSKANRAFWTNGTVPWVSPKDMKSDVIHDTEDHITVEAVGSSATSIVPAGSVLAVTRSGILRRTLPVAVADVPVALNQDLKALRPATGVSNRYVAWALRWQEQQILHECSKDGTTVDSIDFPKLLKWRIPLAPCPEQERIVAAIEEQFSRLDAGNSTLARIRQKLSQMRAAVLSAAVTGRLGTPDPGPDGSAALVDQLQVERTGVRAKKVQLALLPEDVQIPANWQVVPLADLTASIDYGTSEKTRPDVLGVPVLRMGNLGWGSISFDDLKYLPKEQLDPRLLLQPGDLLFNRTNSAELVGKTAVFHDYHEPITFASYLIRARPLPSANMDWASLVLNSPLGRQYVASVRVQQVGQANVNGSKLAAAPIPLPSEEEQSRILREAQRLFSLIDNLESATHRALSRSERLRSSILSAAFSGQLVPQRPSDEPASILLERIAAERAASSARSGRARTDHRRQAPLL